jgi:hypothetical protein
MQHAPPAEGDGQALDAQHQTRRRRNQAESRSAAIDDGFSFSPWHGLAAHRPLGSIMRVRKASYEVSSGFRASHNGCPIHEPRTLETLPG